LGKEEGKRGREGRRREDLKIYSSSSVVVK
jgi:hypothetical protein